MQKILAIVLCFIIGAASYHYAQKRGRNPYTWFALGLLFGIFGLITLFILPILKKSTAIKKVEPPKPSTPDSLEVLDSKYLNKLWYYLDAADQQYGPMSLNALGSAWKEGKLDVKTYVWNEDLADWHCFEKVLKAN